MTEFRGFICRRRESPREEPVEFKVEAFVRETAKALLVQIEEAELWLPKSQLGRVDRYDDGTGYVLIPKWLAVEKGLVDE